MTSGDAESWARLRLVQGESTAQVWELVASAGQTTLTVGSSPSCNWVVREEGVAPVHFSLHWDGATLRVADTFAAGNVRMDGVPVAQQWRPVAGRVRLDFGRAAIVVEASTASRSDAPHPLDPAATPSSSAAPRQNLKKTLIGVSPLTGGQASVPTTPEATPAPVAQHPSEPAGPSESFRPRRPSDSQRAAKPTLVGISMPSGAPAGSRPASQPAPASTASGSAPASAQAPGGQRGVPAGTLMGIGLAEAVAQAQGPQRVGGASLGDSDQRTIQGFPASGPSSAPPAAGHPSTGRRVTQAGMVSEAPGVSPGAVARAPVRAVSSPPPGEPVGGRWQDAPAHAAEIVDAPAADHVIPQAVLVDESVEQRRPRTSSPYPPAGSATPQTPRPRAERFSEAPSHPAMEPPRAKGGSIGAYVGIALLTALAYFAWLYLLDHL